MLSSIQKYTTLVLFLLCTTISTNAAVVIYEIYGAGGNSGAIYQDDFVVLYNSGPGAQSLNGWSLQYASSAGSSWDVMSFPNASIPANGYYFIKLATDNTNGATIGVTDHTTTSLGFTTSGISATQGKLALMSNTTTVSGTDPQVAPNTGLIDFVGYGGANAAEGGSPAPGPSTTSVIHRILPAHQDTNNNGNDFVERSQAGATSFPVELVSISGFQNSLRVELVWKTASETNNDGFAIQKSTNAKDFETIGFVKGLNESSEYSFLDENPKEGLNYYRLEQNDFDETKTLSKIISVLYLSDGEISVYPNPSFAGQQLSIKGLKPDSRYEVYKMNGQLVPVKSKNDFKLSSGSYIIKAFHPFGFESKKIIVH